MADLVRSSGKRRLLNGYWFTITATVDGVEDFTRVWGMSRGEARRKARQHFEAIYPGCTVTAVSATRIGKPRRPKTSAMRNTRQFIDWDAIREGRHGLHAD